MRINQIHHTESDFYLFIRISEIFKTSVPNFFVDFKITFWICWTLVRFVNSSKVIYSKKLVWYVECILRLLKKIYKQSIWLFEGGIYIVVLLLLLDKTEKLHKIVFGEAVIWKNSILLIIKYTKFIHLGTLLIRILI